MSRKWLWILLGITVGSLITAGIFTSGVMAGYLVGSSPSGSALPFLPETTLDRLPIVGDTDVYDDTPPEDIDQLFAPFWQAWDIVHDEYVDQPIDDQAIMRGAIEGALNALGDPHTAYMDPSTYEQANIPLQGSYEGIGAWVDTDAEFLTIVSPMPGSPAEEAGLEPGDRVVAVDGEDVTGMDANLVIRKVLGPAGSTVRLGVAREGERDLLEFEIVRAEIDVPSVHSEMLDGDIGYIQLFSFSNQSAADLRSAIQALEDQGMQAMILDLRGNGGGFLFSAIDVTSEFIESGLILTERFGDGTEETYEANRDGIATEIPLVVLVDAGSASASEIVAGAIQDYERGVLVGETTFGKGSVQNWIPLEEDQGAVRVTVARWYTPDNRLIHEEGLEPDVVVEFTEEAFQAGEDPQLDEAIAILEAGDLNQYFSDNETAGGS
ncbi:MAG: S41 family peptidase [Anaerolineales bacterium]|nr:S41 family peptidase [Anaerolineales bacterium]